MAEHPESALHQLDGVDLSQAECVMVINLQLSGNVSVVSYCVVPKEVEDAAGKLLHQFLNETDEWRNGRFKLLAICPSLFQRWLYADWFRLSAVLAVPSPHW